MGLFGNITRALFGGSKSSSGNKFADQTNASFSPWVAQGTAGMGQAGNILGLGGTAAQGDALKGWWDSSGGNFLMDQGMDQIMGNRAAGGLLRSGGTMKELENYRSDLASSKLNEYMGNLFNLNQQALGAGGLISSSGQTSSGTESKGIGQFLGAILASDPRLKTNVAKVGEYPDGLAVYDYDYLPIEGRIADYMPQGRQRGVMADEVAALRPWALGPEIDGYATVRYDMLGAV